MENIFLVYEDNHQKKIKLWLVSADEIIKHIDEINQYKNVWKLDKQTKKKFNIGEVK